MSEVLRRRSVHSWTLVMDINRHWTHFLLLQGLSGLSSLLSFCPTTPSTISFCTVIWQARSVPGSRHNASIISVQSVPAWAEENVSPVSRQWCPVSMPRGRTIYPFPKRPILRRRRRTRPIITMGRQLLGKRIADISLVVFPVLSLRMAMFA